MFAGDPTNRNWVRAEVQLNSGSSFRVGFEGVVGGDDKTDIALDDISFSAGCYKVHLYRYFYNITKRKCRVSLIFILDVQIIIRYNIVQFYFWKKILGFLNCLIDYV